MPSNPQPTTNMGPSEAPGDHGQPKDVKMDQNLQR